MSEMPSPDDFVKRYESQSTERLKAVCPRLGECGLQEFSLILMEVDSPDAQREGFTNYHEALPTLRCIHPPDGCGFDEVANESLAEDTCDEVLGEVAAEFGLTTTHVQ